MAGRIFYRKRKLKRSPALLLAIEKAGKLAGATDAYWIDVEGRKFLAKGLNIRVQSINHWTDIPRRQIMGVHRLTKVPLHVLAPDLFTA